MKLLRLARSAYWGSFPSINRNVLFWLLALHGETKAAAQLLVGFAVVTTIKGALETPAHSLLASQASKGEDWNLKSSLISTLLAVFSTAAYVFLIKPSSPTIGVVIVLAVLAESFTSLAYSELTASGRLTKQSNRLFATDLSAYAGLIIAVVIGAYFYPTDFLLLCLLFTVVLLFARLGMYFSVCGHLPSLKAADFLLFLQQTIQLRGFFLSSFIFILGSNLYKFLLDSVHGATMLVSVYQLMSCFIISDVLSSATKSNLLSRQRTAFLGMSYIGPALFASFWTVSVSLLAILILWKMKVLNVELLTFGALTLLSLSKVIDAVKGYVKTQLYVARAHKAFFYASLLTIPTMAALAVIYIRGWIDYAWLIFGLSSSAFVILFSFSAKRARTGCQAARSSPK